MPIAIRAEQAVNRRQLLVRSAATVAVAGLGTLARPYLSRAADRPLITSGIQSGDVSADSAVIWARADRPARMQVECSTRRKFQDHHRLGRRRRAAGRAISPQSCCSTICRPGRTSSIACGSKTSPRRLPARRRVGHFRTAPRARSIDLVRLVGRYRGAGLGHRRKPWRHCGLTAPCSTTVRTSSSIPATTSMRTARSERRTEAARTARSGATSSPRRNPWSPTASTQFRGNYKYNWLDAELSRLPRRGAHVRAMGRS